MLHLTQGQCVGAPGGDGECDDEVRAGRVGVHESRTVSPELQHTADDLHHLRGVTHRPAIQRSGHSTSSSSSIMPHAPQMWSYSLVCEGRDQAGASGGRDDVTALADGVALLISRQQVKYVIVVHVDHGHLNGVARCRLLRYQPGSHGGTDTPQSM